MIIDDDKYKLHSMKSLMFLNKRLFSDGGKIHHQGNTANRCAVIAYDDANSGQFVYSARQWDNKYEIYNVFKQTSVQMEMRVRYAIKMTLQTAVLSLLTTPITDSLSTLHDHGTTKCHHTSANCLSKVCVNKRLLWH